MRYRQDIKTATVALSGQFCNSLLSLALIFLILIEASQDTIVVFTANIYIGYLASARIKSSYLSQIYAITMGQLKFDRSDLYSFTLNKEYKFFIFGFPTLLSLNYVMSENISTSIMGAILYTFTLILDLTRNFLKTFMKVTLCTIYDFCTLIYFLIFAFIVHSTQAAQVLAIVAWCLPIGLIFLREYSFSQNKSKIFEDINASMEMNKGRVSVFRNENLISQSLATLSIFLFVIGSPSIYSGVALASMCFLSVPQSVLQALISLLHLRQKNHTLKVQKSFFEFFAFVILYLFWSIVLLQNPILNKLFIDYTSRTPAQYIVIGVMCGGLSLLCNTIFYYLMESTLNGRQFLFYRSCSGFMLHIVPPLACIVGGIVAYNLVQAIIFISVVVVHSIVLKEKK
jgi:hypothetical protein